MHFISAHCENFWWHYKLHFTCYQGVNIIKNAGPLPQFLGRDKSLVQWVEQSDRNKEFIFGLLVAGRNYYAVMHGQRGCGARLISAWKECLKENGSAS